MDSVIANQSGYDQSIDWVPLSLTFVEYPKGMYYSMDFMMWIVKHTS